MDEQEELTFGEKAVGLTFNPSNDPKIQHIKEMYAEIIDELNYIEPQPGDSFVASMINQAIISAQTAQMWTVKMLTWK